MDIHTLSVVVEALKNEMLGTYGEYREGIGAGLDLVEEMLEAELAERDANAIKIEYLTPVN